MRRIRRVEQSLKKFGEDMRTARLKRRLPQSLVAERAGVSVATLRQLENGAPGVSVGNCAAILFALGFDTPFETLASYENDPHGEAMILRDLPQRARARRNM